MTDAERLVLTLTAELMLMADGYTSLTEIEAKSQELRSAMDAMRAEPRDLTRLREMIDQTIGDVTQRTIAEEATDNTEVASDMIEAGVVVLRDYYPQPDDFLARSIVIDIYRAMLGNGPMEMAEREPRPEAKDV